ncbi:MAG: LamG domain-containing protein [Candidatus Micrarchaeia archaeon]
MQKLNEFLKKNLSKLELLLKASSKAQSAMEYLMTYGWAILIIAVVLGALFQLGVFNANNFAPKAPPGSCQVFRPYGPGTTQFINLEGICSGELPEYVAQFNGQNSYIPIPQRPIFNITSRITISAWIYAHPGPNPMGNNIQDVVSKSSSSQNTAYIFPRTDSGWSGIDAYLFTNGGWHVCNVPYGKANLWAFVAMTYNGTEAVIYIDGSVGSSCGISGSIAINSNPLIIGLQPGTNEYFNGSAANIQIYNTSLSANEIQALYQEGIGGAPIDLQHLLAWWPLNGDANDYSGNGNNGVPTNVKFVSNWWSGYTPP